MADRAISINGTQGLGALVVLGRLIGMVLMLMMTDVLGRRAGFMLAIDAHCRPAELQREQGQQKDGEPAAHDRHSSRTGPDPVQILADRDQQTPWGKLLDKAEQLKASVRAKVDHPFRAIKCQFGFTKARYKGLAQNTAQLVTLSALSNLWMARRSLLGERG